MKRILLYPIGTTDACRIACDDLTRHNIPLIDHPAPEVTHLLLDIPSFDASGDLRGGGSVHSILQMLPKDTTLIGGNLAPTIPNTYKTFDLLQDQDYLAVNAAITAVCALKIAAPLLKTTFADTPTLIIGWGRIGKCLGQLLRGMGAPVTIAARNPADRAMSQALGFRAAAIEDIPAALPSCKLLFNTAPELILTSRQLSPFPACIKIDLASKPGILGEDVIIARGLPGIHAPESSGHLIAKTILTYIKEAPT